MFKQYWLIACLIFLLPAVVTAAGRDGYIGAGHLKIHFTIQGRGPAILFLHGGYLNLHSWDREASLLAPKYTIVRFDLPGHGQTTGMDTTLRIADVIKVLLDSLHLPKTSVVGLSLGGACALDFAVAYPERVNKLVLVSAGLSGWRDVLQLDTLSQQLFELSDSVFASKNHQLITETFTHIWCDGPFRKPSDVSPAVRMYIYQTVDSNDLRSSETWPVFDTHKVAKRLHAITVPTLIFAGDKDVPLIVSEANYMHSQIRHSQLRIIKGAAHMINLEQPLLFDHILSTFFAGKRPV